MPATTESLRVQCANCGVKVARIDALHRDGRCFCSEACARLHRRR